MDAERRRLAARQTKLSWVETLLIDSMPRFMQYTEEGTGKMMLVVARRQSAIAGTDPAAETDELSDRGGHGQSRIRWLWLRGSRTPAGHPRDRTASESPHPVSCASRESQRRAARVPCAAM